MFRRGKSPKFASLGQVLPRVLRKLDLEQVVEGQRAVEKWAEAVGTEIARHTRAISFDDGRLLVSVDGPGWMNQLTYLKPQLLKALTRHVKRGMVKDIRFVLKRSRPQS